MIFAGSFTRIKAYLPCNGHGRDSLVAWVNQVQALQPNEVPGLSEAELIKIKTDMAAMKAWLEGLGS